MTDLRTKLIRLAHAKPELRSDLLPLIDPFGARVARSWEKYAKAPPAGIHVPKDVYLRAGRRWLDAIDRKGFTGAVRATEIRIDKIKNAQKAQGIVDYLTGWIAEEKAAYEAKLEKWEDGGKKGRKPPEKYKPAQYTAVEKLIKAAKKKAKG